MLSCGLIEKYVELSRIYLAVRTPLHLGNNNLNFQGDAFSPRNCTSLQYHILSQELYFSKYA